MKKVVLLFVVSLFTAVIANAQAVNKKTIERKVMAKIVKSEDNKAVVDAFERFKESVASRKYYEWNVIFQLMDDTREAYMKLHGGHPATVKATAEYLSQPISINNGAQKINLPDYIRMESVTLYETEQVKFNEFGTALEADLKLVVPSERVAQESLQRVDLGIHFSKKDLANAEAALPVIKTTDNVAKQIRANMYFPTGLNDKKAISDIFQSFGEADSISLDNNLYDAKITASKNSVKFKFGSKDTLTIKPTKGDTLSGELTINGHKVKVIGSVCMDMCFADVTDIDCAEGDEVIIFGNNDSIHRMAKVGDTIPYEIFTSISQRVKRVYYHE